MENKNNLCLSITTLNMNPAHIIYLYISTIYVLGKCTYTLSVLNVFYLMIFTTIRAKIFRDSISGAILPVPLWQLLNAGSGFHMVCSPFRSARMRLSDIWSTPWTENYLKPIAALVPPAPYPLIHEF